MQFVRQSKFRHVFCKPLKKEQCIEDVRVTKTSWDSLFCAVNTKFLAVITEGSGGPFIVIPLTKVGRLDKDFPIVDAHRGPCLDISWCPFNDNVIASCSEDCTAKIWHIPDAGLSRTLKEPIAELLGHQKRVSSIVWHPTANNVLLTAGSDCKIFLWNVASGEALIEIDGHPDLIWSVEFNYDGSKIVTTCKDKLIRVIDPRSGKILQHGMGHEGVKPQRAIFLKNGKIFSTGFTKRSERVYALRDEESLESPITSDELDTSNGVLYPLYDPDSGLVYLCGKGDSNVRYYEINDDPPFVHFINVYSSSEPQRGIGFMPKRGLNVNENEMARIYKCTNKGLVEVLQFFVPRKSELFQEDLYPDTRGTVPALTADEWIAGKNADPILVSLRGEKTALEKPRATVVKKSNILVDSVPTSNSQRLQSSAAPAEVKMRNTATKEPAVGHIDQEQRRISSTRDSRVSYDSHNGNLAKTGVKTAESKKPRIDDDMGIIDFNTISQQQQHHAAAANAEHEPRSARSSYYERDLPPAAAAASFSPRQTSAARTSHQQPPSSTAAAAANQRQSLVSVGASADTNAGAGDHAAGSRRSSCDGTQLEDLIKEIQKLKSLVRGHDRRIRCLEDRLNERESKAFDDL